MCGDIKCLGKCSPDSFLDPPLLDRITGDHAHEVNARRDVVYRQVTDIDVLDHADAHDCIEKVATVAAPLMGIDIDVDIMEETADDAAG